MRHFPLLGSVFRSSVKMQRSAEEVNPPSTAVGSRAIPSRVGMRVNSHLNQTFATTSHQKTRSKSTSLTTRPVMPPLTQQTSVMEIPLDKSILEDFSSSTVENSTTELELLDQTPNVFYRTVMPSTAPPATSNFLQLTELLERLLQSDNSNDPVQQHQIYETIFLEVIRQYFIECSAEGRVLDKCRLFFSSVSKYIPQLNSRYAQELKKVQDMIEQNRNVSQYLKDEIEPMKKKREELNSTFSDLKTDYQLLVKHLDGLNQSLNVTGKEVDNLKAAGIKIDSKISEKNQELIKLNQELRTLDEVSAKSTTDTVTIAEKLKELITNQNELKERLTEESDVVNKKRTRVRTMTMEIAEMEKMLEIQRNSIRHIDISTQHEAIPKSSKQSKKVSAIPSDGQIPQDSMEDDNPMTRALRAIAIAGLNKGDLKGLEIPPEGIRINTFEDLSILKDFIFSNANLFQMSQEDIDKGESGEFIIDENTSESMLKVFSSKIISNCISNAVRKYPTTSAAIQTLPKPPTQASSKATTRPSTKTVKVSKFTKLIPADYSQRDPQDLPWIIKNLRIIYDEKFQADMTKLDKHQPLQNLDEFIIGFAQQHNKLDFIAYQYCWDIHNTATLYANANPEVSLFNDALTGNIDVEQLCFMLICRDFIMKIGACVSIKNDAGAEETTEFYLSQDQLEPALRKWWKYRYNERLYPRLMTLAVARPAIHLEAMKRYVSMSNILTVMVEEYQRDKIDRMYELLCETRILPRISHAEFLFLMKELIPKATHDDTNNFFRATVTKSIKRREISKEDFAIEFLNGSYNFLHDEDIDIESSNDELLEAIKKEWEANHEMINTCIAYFEGLSKDNPDDLKLRTIISDAQRYLMMMTHSLSIKNAQEACFNYYHLVFSLEILFNKGELFDVATCESSLVSLECDVKEYWLDCDFVNRNN